MPCQSLSLLVSDLYGNYKHMTLPFSRFSQCQSPRRGGFSLVEVLVCLGIIGVVSSLALEWYSRAQRDVLQRVTNQRNAQEIVSLGVSATVAGADFVAEDDKFATVQNLVTGTLGTTGVWKDQMFRLNNVPPEAIVDAMPYVAFENGLLLYHSEGGQP